MAFENPFTTIKNLPKPARYAVIAGTAGITGWLLYSHHKNTGSWNPWSQGSKTTSGGQAADINPVTGLAYSQDTATDPVTGLPYLSEAEQYGSVQAAEAAVSAYGLSTGTGSGIPVNPASPPPAGSPNTVVGGNVYTSDSAWAQAATAGLTDIGYDGPTVAAALGAYLTGTPVTPDQAKIINTAIAEFGNPPVGTYQVILIPNTPPLPSQPPPSAGLLPAPAGLSVTPFRDGADFSWHEVSGAKTYELSITGPTVYDKNVGLVTHARVTLKPGNYTWHVRAGETPTRIHGHVAEGRPFTVK